MHAPHSSHPTGRRMLQTDGADAEEVKAASIADALKLAPPANFTVIAKAINALNLTDALSDGSLKATVFAPTDAAFTTALNALNMTAEELLADRALLTKVRWASATSSAMLAAATYHIELDFELIRLA